MNKHNVPVPPDENKIEELLEKIQPIPRERFHQKMKQATWKAQNVEYKVKSLGNHRVRLGLAMAIILILASLLTTPYGRALAQEVFHFFNRINTTTIPLSENDLKRMGVVDEPFDLPLVPVYIPEVSPEMAALQGCETAQKSQSYRCQVAYAESQLGFDLKELPEKPDDWEFEFLRLDAGKKNTTIGYSFDIRYNSYSTLYLFQGLGDYPEFHKNSLWAAVPADKVEIVQVGNYHGEYVQGSFVVPTGSKNMVWSDSDEHQRLAWSDGTRWYLIELWSNLNLPTTLRRDGLIKLATSLVDSPLENAETLDPEFLFSISDAEEVSGFDLKAPTILPIEVNFVSARYYAYNQEVRLFYGINNELVIYEWKGKSLDLERLSKTSHPAHEIVEVNDKKAFYGSVEGPDSHLLLWWEEDGLYYQMYYYRYFGEMISKESMIAIAESMKDIDDFRRKDNKSYEYVSIYASAFGFDAREFEGTPPKWSFVNVWANPLGRCIILIYTSTTEPGSLYINQCVTDKYFDVSDLPTSAIEHVRIGRNRGRYVVGDLVANNNGELIWNPSSPLKRLYWQEGNLWIQITLSGKSTIVYDKEDLISIAESLH